MLSKHWNLVTGKPLKKDMNLVEITQNLLKTFATLGQRLKKGQVSQMTDSVHV